MPTTWRRGFASGLADWYVWGALAPQVFWFSRRFRLGRGTWPACLLLHLVSSVLIVLVQLVLITSLAELLEAIHHKPFPFLDGLRFAFAIKCHWNVVLYWAILGLSHALAYYRESRERELHAAQLQAQLVQAPLQSLKTQLHPHFLFNSLNSISELIYEEPESADRMITHLGELLRMSLEASSAHEVPLQQELDFLRRYLEIQKARFGDRLTTLLDIEIIGECADGLQTVAAIEAQKPDLVFLDVQMPEVDRLGVVQAVGPQRMPLVVFVTAYDCYAVKAFEVSALDYLLKPVNRERFQAAVARARSQMERGRTGEVGQRLQALLEHLKSGQEYSRRLMRKSEGRVFFLTVDEIDWIEAAHNYLVLHVGHKSHLIRETMDALEARLDPDYSLSLSPDFLLDPGPVIGSTNIPTRCPGLSSRMVWVAVFCCVEKRFGAPGTPVWYVSASPAPPSSEPAGAPGLT